MQLEYDIAEYILSHPEAFQEIKSSTISLISNSSQINVFKEEFNSQLESLLLSQIKQHLSCCFSLNCEELSVIITKEFMEQLIGKEFFFP